MKDSVPIKIVCFFGIYDPEYSRNAVLSKGFKENSWSVVHARVDPLVHTGFSKYIELIRQWHATEGSDLILVAFPGHTVVWLARILWPTRKIYFDAFLSRYDSNVHDRKSHKAFSLRGIVDWFLDWSSCMLAHKVFFDTNEHIKYFSKQFGIPKKKMIRVPVGAQTDIFYPRELVHDPKKFVVYFHGMFIPLQGLKYIAEAAALLRDHSDIIFTIIGSGQQFNEISKLVETRNLSNIQLLGKKPLLELPAYIEKADICLGIFGDTEKTTRVIPNKVYECIAMKKAIITADTPAVKEFFTHGKHMMLCERASGASIADAILKLKNNPEQRRELAENSHAYFIKYMSPRAIVSDIIKSLYL